MVINCFYLETNLSQNLKASMVDFYQMGGSGENFMKMNFFFFLCNSYAGVCVNFHSKIANKHRQKGDLFCQIQDNKNQEMNATLASVNFASM